MPEQVVLTRTQDVDAVGSRISWSAILAGALLAFGIYALLTILGATVGLSISDRVRPTTLKTTAIIWTAVTMMAALFVGGVAASYFTTGENKTEGLLYGLIVWAVLFCFLTILSATGIHAGFYALTASRTSELSENATGATVADIQDVQRKANAAIERKGRDTDDQKGVDEATTRLAWYAFGGSWLSMLAAAIGGWVGAGPMFRTIVVRASRPA